MVDKYGAGGNIGGWNYPRHNSCTEQRYRNQHYNQPLAADDRAPEIAGARLLLILPSRQLGILGLGNFAMDKVFAGFVHRPAIDLTRRSSNLARPAWKRIWYVRLRSRREHVCTVP